MSENDSFHDMNKKEKLITVVAITLLIIVAVGFVLGIFFFGFVGVFELLGVQYTSVWSLIVFVISFFVIGIIVDLIFKPIFKLILRNITGKLQTPASRFVYELVSNWFVLFTVDEFMRRISLSVYTEVIMALLLAVLELVFDGEKKVNKS
ncbi:YrvL family regulatory protein [Gracilibacillus saliphilus]|uniref:YrvL family regulatory protein n=1 Tax=Gracilibacillus saliphilus TaxID=543890 RepID=UPI0013D62B83|nr:YrvL family regulatory protein [Gracilibacillus saliphilus]